MNIDYSIPVRLIPVHIPKPWGQEIWYSGMEQRGESRALLADGTELPLSSYLGHDPHRSSANEPVLLLKVLDPLPEPVRGDLYLEVHREKREVYIVTHIDGTAWPDGTGGIRFGMSQEKRADHADDATFRGAFLEAVKSYEKVRRAIDSGTVSPFLVMQELSLRKRMDAFTHMRPLKVGDVVHVPTWFPHSLQHGVRVVEFQTQTYERLIVSFAQKVLTQDHWDTADAIDGMSVGPPPLQQPEHVSPGIERIARFDHFNVWRVCSDAGRFALPDELPYAVVMCLGGPASIGALRLAPQQAALIPMAALANTTLSTQDEPSLLLVAAPGL